jgi:hypothetical protein
MLSRLLRFLTAVLLVVALSLPYAAGQSNSSLPSVERGVKADAAGSEKSGASPAALPYFALIIYTMLILTIVCMPSRKA